MKLLPNIRNECLIIWIFISFISLIILFLQTLSGGLLLGIVRFAWIWEFVNIGPGLLILIYSLMQQVLPLKFIPEFKARALKAGTYAYGGMFLLIILIEPWVIANTELSMQQYLMVSLWLLVPVNILLTLSYYWSFVAKDGVGPNQQQILAVAKGYAEKWGHKGNEQKKSYFEAIASGDLHETLSALKDWFSTSNDKRLNDIILLQSEFNAVQRSINLNLVDRSEAQISINRITVALLNLIEAL